MPDNNWEDQYRHSLAFIAEPLRMISIHTDDMKTLGRKKKEARLKLKSIQYHSHNLAFGLKELDRLLQRDHQE